MNPIIQIKRLAIYINMWYNCEWQIFVNQPPHFAPIYNREAIQMNSLRQTVMTVVKAARYSIAFCWRNQKRLSLVRLSLAVALALLSYIAIFANGLIINTVQIAVARYQPGDFYTEFARSGLLWPVLLILGILLTARILGSYSGLVRGNWNQAIRFSNQRELQLHKATLDMATIQSKEYDDLNRRISELPTGWNTRIMFSEEMLGLLTTAVSFVTFGVSLTLYNPYYTIVIVVTSIPMMMVEFKIVSLWWSLIENLVPEHKKRSVLERPYYGTTEFVQALMFNQMPHLRKEIDINVDNVLERNQEVRRTSVRSRLWVNCLTIFGLIGVILHASWSTISDVGKLGTLTIIIGAARTFQGNIEYMVSLVAEQWNNAKGVILIEENFLSIKPSIKTDYPVVPPRNITPEIFFDHVSFRYPSRKELALDDVSFVIKPGSKVAIVGDSGNGKSTIQALMMRQYDPTTGNVLVGGINLRNICPRDWSEVVSSLTQKFAVLERSIGEEIGSSRFDEPINLTSLENSVRFANFSSVVENDPKGFDSQIGTRFGGREFSGGEEQRLALARVHYRGTPVLILDEPDAKLDAVSAGIVMDNIFALTGVTVVLITHHVSRAERCDHIIVMGKGKVVEQGTHEELMALGGTYVSIREKDRRMILGEEHLGVQS